MSSRHLVFTLSRRDSVLSPLRLRRQRRNSPIRRIHNQRSSPSRDDLGSPVVPKLIVGNHSAWRVLRTALRWIDEITILAPIVFDLKLRRFFRRKDLLPRQLTG